MFDSSERAKDVLTQGFCVNNAWACSWRFTVLVEEWFHSVGIKPYWVAFDLSLYKIIRRLISFTIQDTEKLQ